MNTQPCVEESGTPTKAVQGGHFIPRVDNYRRRNDYDTYENEYYY